MTELHLIRPDDWHLHLRDGAELAAALPHSARQFARAIVMPNLKPPVTTVDAAAAYKARIVAALPPELSSTFEPLMTLYLTDRTAPDEVRRGREAGIVHAVKLYPAGATTHSDAGVTDIRRVAPVLETMQRIELPLLVHGEVTDPAVDVFDRERLFIERVLIPLRRDFPALRIVLEHITTREAADYVAAADGPIAATITAHHLAYSRNALFIAPGGGAGLRPHYYCLPLLKREVHRQALIAAACGGNPRFFLGTDSAPHPRAGKEAACACAGCFTAASALELYATVFDQAGALDRLEGFASLHGPDFYRLPRNAQRITLERRPTVVPEALPFGDDVVIPLAAGETLPWRLARRG